MAVTETAARFEIPDELLTRLREDVILRRIGTSIQWFEEHRDALLFLDPDQKNAAAFVGYFSQWVDIGYGDAAIVGELLQRFPKEKRASLPLCDYIHLELAEGMVASAEEETAKAVARFDLIITLGEEAVADRQLLSLAHFWKARCKRKQGEYDSALAHCRKGRELALELGYTRMAAVMQVLESWLCFQKEKLAEAAAILQEAEAALRETDDSVTLGNIQSGHGRIALREARYDQALEHFARAIELYRKRDPRHRNLARCLANMAYVKRLSAIRLAQKVDAEAKHRRKGAAVSSEPVPAAMAPSRQRVEQLRTEVLANLAQAEEIYRSVHHHRGWGTVHVERALLFLDIGDVERAGDEAGEAYQLAAEKKDNILMARARVVESMIESAKYEEGLDEDPTVHAQRALDYARDALTFAKHTENRHLLARAYIFQGMALSSDFFNDPDAARECCDRAAEYLTPGIHDHLWEEHQALKARVLRGGNLDVMLRKWSQGATDDQSFQQLTERFAEVIIPKVWEREGKKISRVALKLSISPKKVRRILGRLGLKGD
ncbi:MAG TPA: tetratricopeptide repeat protein [Bryobacteraceae bacterium]|nr:tetratricopeptide repeat protein [Bryobacteraceae bacterium]